MTNVKCQSILKNKKIKKKIELHLTIFQEHLAALHTRREYGVRLKWQ